MAALLDRLGSALDGPGTLVDSGAWPTWPTPGPARLTSTTSARTTPPTPATSRPARITPRTVKAPEARLDQITGLFFARHVFGPDRAALLAAQLPASDAEARAARASQAAALNGRLRQIETAVNSCILELEQLPADPADPAAAAIRARIRARFAELHREQQDKTANGYDDTGVITAGEVADVEDLFESPIAAWILHKDRILPRCWGAGV